MSIRILIADDHKIVRDGLRVLIEQQFGMKVIGDAENGNSAVRMAEELKPDIIIMDISMPNLNGIEATRQIITNIPKTKIIILSMHSEKRFIERVLRAGASGYLRKECAFEELRNAIETVITGDVYLSPEISNIVVSEYLLQISKNNSSPFATLTPREREVLQLLAEGKSTKQIASILFVSVKTIETHRRQLMKKLKIRTIAGLTKYAIREGFTSLDI